MGVLSDIMQKLHINTMSEIERFHNAIRENFTITNFRPKDYEDCHRYLSKYYRYHFAAAAGVSIVVPEDTAYSEVRRILEKSQGGYIQNIKNTLRGWHGGTKVLIDSIAEEMKKEAMEKYVGYVIGTHVNPLDYDLKIALASQYLEKYGKYILPGEALMSPYELAANFESVIKMHVEMVNRYRNIVQ